MKSVLVLLSMVLVLGTMNACDHRHQYANEYRHLLDKEKELNIILKRMKSEKKLTDQELRRIENKLQQIEDAL